MNFKIMNFKIMNFKIMNFLNDYMKIILLI